MSQFVIYSICGFCEAWLSLFLWGYTNGPINAIPYFAVVGSLLLLTVGAPMALFLPRIGAAFGLVNVALMFPWPAFILLQEHSLAGFAFSGVAPVVAGATAVRHLLKTRRKPWLGVGSSPSLAVRVPLALLPLALFILSFNARLVVTLLLEGPPR